MKWLCLIGAILCEVLGTSALKLASQGGKHAIHYGVTVVLLYSACFALLGVTFRYFDLGTVYAIWSGVGVTLLAAIGIVFFGDSITFIKVVSILFIIIGIVGLNLSGMTH